MPDVQLRVADAVTKFAGSMKFVYVHIVIFEQEQELKLNTELTKAIHALAQEIHRSTCGSQTPPAI